MEIITNRKPLVSVIIDTYNYGRFIDEAIESVLSQTFPQKDMEIIVVDDGSTDDTHERVKKYKDKIKYIYKENGGQASAFNVGFENARGELIALLDSDDYWYPDKLKYVVTEFEKSETIDVVFHYMNLVNNEGKIIGTYPDSKIESEIYFEKYPLQNYLKGILPFFPPTSGITLKADCFKKIFPVPDDFWICADLYMQLILPFHAREFALVKKHLGNYRIHGNNLWTGNPLTVHRINEEIKLCEYLTKYVKKEAHRLGYNSTLLEKKMDLIMTEKEILLYKFKGEKFKALRKAILFNDPTSKAPILYRIFRKFSMVISIILPYSKYLWLREKYKNSFMFTIVHRFLIR
jgi:glycosyltransferase involved in cell wall biosynthesis